MHNTSLNDGYVEDSEDEGDMMVDALHMRNAVGGLPPPPQLPPPARMMDTTVSTIQTPNFTSLPPARNQPPETPINVHNTTVSTIQSANFTMDRSAVSDISSFSPIGAAHSTIQTAQAAGTSSGSSISTSTSAPAPAAPRGKPRPRPVFKKKDITAAALAADASTSSGIPSSISVLSAHVSFPSFYAMPPPLPPMLASSTPSYTATTVLATPRVSDSGVEIMDVDRMDIAERAKLRSRGRSQAKAKQITYDDVIELSSSDDELSLPKSKPKPKPKPKAKKPAAPKEPSSDKGKSKGKSRDPSKPSPSKRAKTAHIPDGAESDVDTIPVATSDFPIPDRQPPIPPLPPHMRDLSSQLPPSDPPPSTSGSSAPRASQDGQLNANTDMFRDESPLSSPPPPMPRKRKRPSPPTHIPALYDDDNSYMGADEDSILAGPAPGGMVPIVEITKVPKKSRSKESDPLPAPPSPGVVPETQHADPPAKDQEKPAPQKKKRKRGVDDGEEWDAGLDEELLAQAAKSKSKKRSRVDEEDEEEYGASSSKAKGKAKKDKEKPAKKAAKEKAPPKEKGTKGKAGAKGKASSSSSKGVVEGSDGEERSISIGGDKPPDAMPPPPPPEPASKRKEKDRPSSFGKGTSDDPEVPVDAPAPKRGKGKQRALVLSDDEDDGAHAADVSTNASAANASLDIDSPPPAPAKKGGRKSTGGEQGSKENEAPPPPPFASPPTANSSSHAAAVSTPVRPVAVTPQPARTSFAHANRAYTISSKKTKSTPMSELIRRVSSLPGSPFPASSRPTFSPLAKASKSTLRRIAPLHPNRRTPPPPPPRPPPPKKSKKMLELEEKWEMELEDSIDGWYAMPEEERATLRRAKRDHELGFED